MRPKALTLTGSGSGTTNSAPLRVNWRAETTSLSLKTSGSTTGFSAQYTLTSPDGYASGTAWAAAATWHTVDDISAVTANAAAGIFGPVHGVRLQANASGTDTGTLTVIQAAC